MTGAVLSDEAVAVSEAVTALLGSAPREAPHRLTGGASRSTWRCTAGDDRIVVQRQRAGAERDMEIEADVVRAAATAGVPVPEVLGFGVDDLGVSTLITRDVAGETIARKILRDDQFHEARPVLAADLGPALARVHRIDASQVAGLTADDVAEVYRARLDEIGQPHPAFELAFRWLDAHRPPAPDRPVVVHGDYRLGNMIVDRSGLAAVIDWELVHLGDPLEDLGWLCVPAWRFGSPLPAAGVGTRAELMQAYTEESGVDVDPEHLRWWEVSGILRWGIICVSQAHTHRSGQVRSHELAAIGRRVCENEHDLFLALDGRW